MATVLVTGGAGYIGSHACKALAAAGHVPVAYDTIEQGHRWAVQWGPLVVGDTADRPRLDAAIAEHRPEAVMHFAGYLFVGESVREPGKYYANNTAASVTLVQALTDAGIDKLVFSSTAAVYGTPDTVPIPEDAPKQPINPYGNSKWMVEQILRDVDAAKGLRSVSLRYFNAAGADPDGDIGEAHDPETHLIPRALMAAAGEISHLDLFGTDYPTPDGTAVRDYIHVTDLVAAHVQALDYLMAGGRTDAFNLGTGTGISVRQIIAAADRVSGAKTPVREAPRREGDPASLIADPSRAAKILGFAPKFTTIDPIVDTAWQWYRGGFQTHVGRGA